MMTPEQADYARQIAAWAQPGRPGYDQLDWIHFTGQLPDDSHRIVNGEYVVEVPITMMREGSCGTETCIAGRVAIERAPEGTLLRDSVMLVFPDDSGMNIEEFARRELGLTRDQSDAVFYCNSPQAGQRLAYFADHPDATGAAAAVAYPSRSDR
jgi:hypothetical protein